MKPGRDARDSIVLLPECAVRALACALDPQNIPAIDFADWRTIFHSGARGGVIAQLKPRGNTEEAWHDAILQGLAAAGQTLSTTGPAPAAMLLCVDRGQVAAGELAGAVAAMRRMAPAAAILATRGALAGDGAAPDACPACLFTIW